MAKITCKICGGAIKMQANMVGVCQDCGMEYDIDAVKAMVGKEENGVCKNDADPGDNSEKAELVSEKDTVSSNIKQNKEELERQAVIIYLNELRTLESIIFNKERNLPDYNQTRSKCEAEIDEYIQSHEPKKPVRPSTARSSKGPVFTGIGLGLILLALLLILAGMSVKWLSADGYFLAVPGLVFTVLGIKFRKDQKERDEDIKFKFDIYNKEMREYSKKKETYDHNVEVMKEKARQKADSVRTESESAKQELQYYRSVLENAYSVNIIPNKFRNFNGVCCLYDYMSSSKLSFEKALDHVHLEEINYNVLKTQAEIIIHQMNMNETLEEMFRQNNEILETARRTAANTEEAAKYSKMTALNAEMMKSMIEKQTFMQEMEYWERKDR